MALCVENSKSDKNNVVQNEVKKKQKKEIKLEPYLKIFGTVSILLAVLYCFINAIELFLIYNTNYFHIFNVCYIWIITLTPMFFNRLCIYLYLIFRIYGVFKNSSIYGVSKCFICIITTMVVTIFVSTYTFFIIYIT